MNYYTAIMILTGAILIILGVLVHENARMAKEDKIKFYISYLFVAIAAAAEWVGVNFNGKSGYAPQIIMVAKFLDYVFTPSSGGALVWNVKCNKTLRTIVVIVLNMNLIFQIICLPFNGVFYVDENNCYHHGRLYPFYIGFYAVILLLTAIAFFQYGRYFTYQNKLSMYLVVVLAVAGIVVQEFVGDNIRIAYLTLATSMGILYIRYAEYTLQQSDERLKNQQYQIMFSQIQPHFLFNCLSVIRETYHGDMEKGDKAIVQFSNFLRYNMDALSGEDIIPFEKELEHVKEYAALQELRFQDTLRVEYDLQVTDFDIPTLTLQPIVENSIRHGARKNPDGFGVVKISTRELKDVYEIEVSDNGPGFEVIKAYAEGGKDHVGILNVRDRLRLFIKGDLRIESTPDAGTVCTIMIPKGK